MRSEQGSTLLEVVVAMTVLASVASAALTIVLQVTHTMSEHRSRTAEMEAASRLLAAAALWPAADLDRRLGERRQGPFRMEIARPETDLYRIEIRDSLGHGILATAVYRPETDDSR